jgi:hypothetical protein
MKLSMFERKPQYDSTNECTIEAHGATLRVVQPQPRVRTWEPVFVRSGDRDPLTGREHAGGIQAKVEITAKRFNGNDVDQDRYEAMLNASDGSPSSLIAALSRAVAEVEDFQLSGGPDERVILQISVIR